MMFQCLFSIVDSVCLNRFLMVVALVGGAFNKGKGKALVRASSGHCRTVGQLKLDGFLWWRRGVALYLD